MCLIFHNQKDRSQERSFLCFLGELLARLFGGNRAHERHAVEAGPAAMLSGCRGRLFLFARLD